MRRRDFIAGQATALFYNPPLTIPVLRTRDSLLKPIASTCRPITPSVRQTAKFRTVGQSVTA